MEGFWDSVKLMLFVYALAAAVSFTVAWIIKLIFAGIQKQKARADSGNEAPAKAPIEPANGTPETTA